MTLRGNRMRDLLILADGIDAFNRWVAAIARWALLANALVITVNAIARKFFSIAYPSAFDLQWHFFAVVVMLMAPYALQRDEHVRIDILAGRMGGRGLAWLDMTGTLLFLIPVCILMVWASWPGFVGALIGFETRSTRDSMSDIPAWIMKGLIVLGFLLLALQGIAEAIRCAAHLKGTAPRADHRSLLSEGERDV